jgi:hypothetical protein
MVGAATMTGRHSKLPAAGTSEEWKLVWSDEFDHLGWPDARNWTYETGLVRNEELQWYQPQNAWCEGDLLIGEGRREHEWSTSPF